MVSSSGISSDMSENKLSAYETSDTVELRILEENEEEPSQDPRSSLLQLHNYTKYQLLGRQESHQSISVILDNIWGIHHQQNSTSPPAWISSSKDKHSREVSSVTWYMPCRVDKVFQIDSYKNAKIIFNMKIIQD